MSALAQIAQMARPWSSLYGDTPALQVATAFAHFGGLLLGGGFAIVADTATIRAARASEPRRRRQLAYIHGIHRIVLAGLALTFISGLVMFAADVESFATSTVFWVKMALVALLLANGGVMTLTESRLRGSRTGGGEGWQCMQRVAACSFALWFATILAGTVLVNAGQ